MDRGLPFDRSVGLPRLLDWEMRWFDRFWTGFTGWGGTREGEGGRSWGEGGCGWEVLFGV